MEGKKGCEKFHKCDKNNFEKCFDVFCCCKSDANFLLLLIFGCLWCYFRYEVFILDFNLDNVSVN